MDCLLQYWMCISVRPKIVKLNGISWKKNHWKYCTFRKGPQWCVLCGVSIWKKRRKGERWSEKRPNERRNDRKILFSCVSTEIQTHNRAVGRKKNQVRYRNLSVSEVRQATTAKKERQKKFLICQTQRPLNMQFSCKMSDGPVFICE